MLGTANRAAYYVAFAYFHYIQWLNIMDSVWLGVLRAALVLGRCEMIPQRTEENREVKESCIL